MIIFKNLALTLLTLGLVLILLPGSGKYSFTASPDELYHSVLMTDPHFTADQVASFFIREDSTVQLIDLRPGKEYKEHNIPGSINIPYDQFFSLKPEEWLYNKSMKYIFYSNGDRYSAYAMTIARGLGYENCYFMPGGLNEWYRTIMLSEFSGARISPRENALFETRVRARNFYTEINSLPDSLKLKYAESRRQAERELDGGCE